MQIFFSWSSQKIWNCWSVRWNEIQFSHFLHFTRHKLQSMSLLSQFNQTSLFTTVQYKCTVNRKKYSVKRCRTSKYISFRKCMGLKWCFPSICSFTYVIPEDLVGVVIYASSISNIIFKNSTRLFSVVLRTWKSSIKHHSVELEKYS